jgi:hypothetical protein
VTRATYKRAVAWLAANDDNEWLRAPCPMVSVSAALVMDLWGKSERELLVDLLGELRHIHPNSWYGKYPWET